MQRRVHVHSTQATKEAVDQDSYRPVSKNSCQEVVKPEVRPTSGLTLAGCALDCMHDRSLRTSDTHTQTVAGYCTAHVAVKADYTP